jgi:hypothetical protein
MGDDSQWLPLGFKLWLLPRGYLHVRVCHRFVLRAIGNRKLAALRRPPRGMPNPQPLRSLPLAIRKLEIGRIASSLGLL